MSQKKVYSLSSLARSIQNVINNHCNKVVWLKAEIVKLNYYSKSGHCYPTLVEKKNGKVIAELRGNIWSEQFKLINRKFRAVLGEQLKDDMTVVIQGSVTFHPVHGIALNIIDIDPEYTLGELAREKAETVAKLKAENLFDQNKTTVLPALPKTIAVISVETSKGYLDFVNVIENNSRGYKFHHLLFPAVLQGERAVGMIAQQLEKISRYTDVFDAVAIIRGGGGEIGLSSFDNYFLATKIATFPLPVLTGIGHATNETVSELVSFQSFITPTKIAEFLLQKFYEFEAPMESGEAKMRNEINWLFKNHKNNLKESARLFTSLTNRSLDNSRSNLRQMAFQLGSFAQRNLNDKKDQLRQAKRSLLLNATKPVAEERKSIRFSEEKLEILSPANILKRGFSITRQNGKVIRTAEELESNLPLETKLYSGTVSSRIEKTTKRSDND